MLRELFEAAVSEPPPCGIGHSPQSRAMYAVDLLLKWDETPNGMYRCMCQSLSQSQKLFTYSPLAYIAAQS
jgi:tubulin--tyrosine ligase-like protein 12